MEQLYSLKILIYFLFFQEYCSILFLKPRMKIILRGKKVKTKLISQSLSRTEKDVYKPLWLVSLLLILGHANNG